MANHMGILAHALGLQQFLLDEFHVSSRLVLQSTQSEVAREAQSHLQELFPIWKSVDFDEGCTPEIKEAMLQRDQDDLLHRLDDAVNSVSNKTFPH